MSTGLQILLPFKVAFQHECHLLNLSGHVLEASLTMIVTYLFWFKLEPRGLSCHAFIAFLIGLFIPLWLSTGIR